MLGLIAANVRRRRARTFLTAAGIAVGVAALVALLALSAGLNRTAGQLVRLGGADLGLFQRDAGDPRSSVLPLSMLKRLRAESQMPTLRRSSWWSTKSRGLRARWCRTRSAWLRCQLVGDHRRQHDGPGASRRG